MSTTDRPAVLDHLSRDLIVDVDVREELRAGREPFALIMEGRRTLPDGGALRVRAIFEPYPLYRVMAGQGLDHWTERLADDDWRVWFFRAAAEAGGAGTLRADAGGVEPGGPSPDAGAEVASSRDDTVPRDAVVLDVRGLEPPEPMVRTLEALEDLPAGVTLIQINHRVPRFLLPELEARGFLYHIRRQDEDLVRVFIQRRETDMHEHLATLDVRVIPPREKHPTIFRAFDALAPGESFVLVNDHDPVPLRYQFQHERPDGYSWTYLEEGPEVWRVEIGRAPS